MSNDQLDQQVVELDNLSEHREIVTFMRRSMPLNTSQRTALEQYGHLILEYPVGDLRQHFEHPERPLTVEIGFGMGRSLVLMAKANPERNFVGIEVHVPGIAQCIYEAGMAGVTNLRVLDADAIQVLREMPDKKDRLLIQSSSVFSLSSPIVYLTQYYTIHMYILKFIEKTRQNLPGFLYVIILRLLLHQDDKYLEHLPRSFERLSSYLLSRSGGECKP